MDGSPGGRDERRLEHLRYLKYAWVAMEIGLGLVGSSVAGFLLGTRLDQRVGRGQVYATLLTLAGLALGLFNGYKALRILERKLGRDGRR